MTDHKLGNVVTRDGRVSAFCVCGWASGARRNRAIAAMAVAAHIAAEEADRTTRARAIVSDHSLGLHEDWYDPTIGCTYRGCEESAALMAALEEADQ